MLLDEQGDPLSFDWAMVPVHGPGCLERSSMSGWDLFHCLLHQVSLPEMTLQREVHQLSNICQGPRQWTGLLHQLQGLRLGIKLHLISLSASLPSPQTVRPCGVLDLATNWSVRP